MPPPDELKAAFRNLARKLHPDVNKAPDAEERFKEINEAYAVLSDADKRAAYDRYGHAGVNGAGAGMPDFSSVDLSDILEGFFGFGGGGGRRSNNSARRGEDLGSRVQITFEESVFGVEKEIEITRDETCSTCHGRGAEPGTNPTRCTTCGGKGVIRQVRQTILGSMVQETDLPSVQRPGRGNHHPLPYLPRARPGTQDGAQDRAHPGGCGQWHANPPGRRGAAGRQRRAQRQLFP